MLDSTLRLMLTTVVVMGGALGAAALTETAKAQSPADAAREPRFLVASAASSSRVAPLDMSRTPVLRQRLALDFHDVTVKAALEIIAGKAGLKLAYSEDLVPLQRHVSLRADGITVAAALTDVLVDANVDVVFLPEGRAVVRQRADAVPLPGGTVRGRITDARTTLGIAGVDVFLEGTRWRTTTDSGGAYHIDADTGTYTLIARRLGYTKQSRRITVREGQKDTISFVLEPFASKLADLVTTATGVQRRRDIGNAVTTIQADSVMRTAPIRNLTDLLENRVPGLTVQHTSGAPGDPSRLRLRGLNSVLRSNDPVVVVDGVRVYAAQADARSGNLTNLIGLSSQTIRTGPDANNNIGSPPALPVPSPLDQIDPNTIEKIEVFKGPSAATLYGADAANGVIVITTKKGRPGPARWNATLSQGITNTLNQYPTGYYRWGHSLFDNVPKFCTLVNGFDPPCIQDSLVRYQALNDPEFTVIGQGHRTAGSLTVSGGSQTLQYSLTGSYGDETGLMRLPDFEVARFQTLVGSPAPDWMRRPHHYLDWSTSNRVTAQLGPTADVTLATSLSRSEQSRTSLEQQLPVLAGTYVDRATGLYYVPSLSSYTLSQTAEVLQNFYQRATASAFTFTTGLSGNWRPRAWLNGTAQAGINLIPRRDELLLPVGPPGFGSDSGSLVQGTGRSLVSTLNLQSTVRKSLGHGFRFETSAGANLTTQRTDNLSTSAVGLVPGTSSLSGAQRFFATDGETNSSVFGYYVEPRLLGERLSLSTGLRLDGGSAYGARITRQSGGLFGLLSLPKLNGSWVVSEEPWFPFKAVVNSLRLRGAYGQAQVQPSPADRLRLYTRAATADEQFLLDRLGNTQLRPERDGELEGGFDADLLDSRLSLEVTGYRKTARDALLPVALPISVGGGSVLTNIGTTRNTGWDVTTRLTPLRTTAATWTVELSYSENTNLLTKLGRGVAPNPNTGLVAGYPIGGRWARPIIAYADLNGNGVLDGQHEIQVGDSAVYVGRLLPKSQTALHTNMALFGGAVGVSAAFSYAAGATQIDQTASTNWVLSRALVDPTAPLGEQAAVQEAVAVGFGTGTYYGVIQSISTFRFDALSVNYRAPAALTRLVHAQQLSVAVQGSNLGLHSTYHGRDPDVNSWQPGENIVDTGQLPLPRTWQLSVYATY